MAYDDLYNSIIKYQRQFAQPVKGYGRETERRVNSAFFTDLRNTYLANKYSRDSGLSQMRDSVYGAMAATGNTRGSWAGQALEEGAGPIEQAYDVAQQGLGSSLRNWEDQKWAKENRPKPPKPPKAPGDRPKPMEKPDLQKYFEEYGHNQDAADKYYKQKALYDKYEKELATWAATSKTFHTWLLQHKISDKFAGYLQNYFKMNNTDMAKADADKYRLLYDRALYSYLTGDKQDFGDPNYDPLEHSNLDNSAMSAFVKEMKRAPESQDEYKIWYKKWCISNLIYKGQYADTAEDKKNQKLGLPPASLQYQDKLYKESRALLDAYNSGTLTKDNYATIAPTVAALNSWAEVTKTGKITGYTPPASLDALKQNFKFDVNNGFSWLNDMFAQIDLEKARRADQQTFIDDFSDPRAWGHGLTPQEQAELALKQRDPADYYQQKGNAYEQQYKEKLKQAQDERDPTPLLNYLKENPDIKNYLDFSPEGGYDALIKKMTDWQDEIMPDPGQWEKDIWNSDDPWWEKIIQTIGKAAQIGMENKQKAETQLPETGVLGLNAMKYLAEITHNEKPTGFDPYIQPEDLIEKYYIKAWQDALMPSGQDSPYKGDEVEKLYHTPGGKLLLDTIVGIGTDPMTYIPVIGELSKLTEAGQLVKAAKIEEEIMAELAAKSAKSRVWSGIKGAGEIEPPSVGSDTPALLYKRRIQESGAKPSFNGDFAAGSASTDLKWTRTSVDSIVADAGKDARYRVIRTKDGKFAAIELDSTGKTTRTIGEGYATEKEAMAAAAGDLKASARGGIVEPHSMPREVAEPPAPAPRLPTKPNEAGVPDAVTGRPGLPRQVNAAEANAAEGPRLPRQVNTAEAGAVEPRLPTRPGEVSSADVAVGKPANSSQLAPDMNGTEGPRLPRPVNAAETATAEPYLPSKSGEATSSAGDPFVRGLGLDREISSAENAGKRAGKGEYTNLGTNAGIGANDFKIIDGKVAGKIPVDEYKAIRISSIQNPTEKTFTLGKYTSGPDSYIARAGKKSSYFNLGDDWGRIQKKYHLTDREMFDYFNKPALDDAIARNQTIRFSHDPRLYDHGFIVDEWEYIKKILNLIDDNLKEIGGFWYVQ